MTSDLIIKPDRVVTCPTCVCRGQLLLYLMYKVSFDQAILFSNLWCDCRYQTSFWRWQPIFRWLAVQYQRFPDRLQVKIGTNSGKLCWSVEHWIDPEGLVVVPEKGWLSHFIK